MRNPGENVSSVLEEQLIVRRGWSDHDVAPLFSLRAEVAVENTVHRVHSLWTSADGEIGIPTALGTAKLAASFLYRVKPHDPEALAIAVLTLLAAAPLATTCLLDVRRESIQ